MLPNELEQLLCRLQQRWSLHQVLCCWLADELLSVSLQRLVQHPASHQREPGVAGWWLHHWCWRTIEYVVKVFSPSFKNLLFINDQCWTICTEEGWWSWGGGPIDFFQAVIEILHVIPICKALSRCWLITTSPKFFEITFPASSLVAGAHGYL